MSSAVRFLPILFFALLSSCGSEPASAPPMEMPETLGPNAALIRSPLDGQTGTVDTTNVARLTFSDEPTFEFGEVKEGALVEHDFNFTNTGAVPLLITSARSTCGCTVPGYPEAPVAPGEAGVISVAFDTKNKTGRQSKPVTITANTYPTTTVVYVSGNVTNDK